MLRNVHGEGHPALWYLILRGAHDFFPYREVLPVAGAVLGIGAMAIFAFCSPFRLFIVALVLFSLFGAFDYVVVARNYGIAALVMFALWQRCTAASETACGSASSSRSCATPMCQVACLPRRSCCSGSSRCLPLNLRPSRRDWLIFAGNAALAAVGAALCFITVYPTFNNAAISGNSHDLSVANLFAGLLD